MRIHSDTLTYGDLAGAAGKAKVVFTTADQHGSRKRDHAWEVKLSGDSPYRQAGNPEEFAASWDQWGIFLAELFRRDPAMTCGGYPDRGTFNLATGDRFFWLEYGSAEYHRRHKWEPDGFYGAHCKCGAFQFWGWRYGMAA
jgi:hypothetical protein